MNRFYAGSDIIFGQGSLSALPELLKEFDAKRVMVISDRGVCDAGITGKVVKLLEGGSAVTALYSDVQPNPTNENVMDASEQAKAFAPDLFVAVGGGSSSDLAKAVSLLMTNDGPIERYAGIGNVPKKGLPLIALPTTSGTSSEITNVCALIDTKKVVKYVIIDNKITADRVIADPCLTMTVPPSVTAATGMDAITHAIESYISNMASPMTAYHSLAGLQTLYESLPKAYEDGADICAREQMMLGCLITGFGFSNANLGLVHGIAHTLSAHFGLAHGAANAAVLPYVIAYNAPSCPGKMVDMARKLGLPLIGDQDRDMYALSDAMKALNERLKIRTLSQHGIQEADLAMLAKDVLAEPVLNFNPRQGIMEKDVLGILKEAF